MLVGGGARHGRHASGGGGGGCCAVLQRCSRARQLHTLFFAPKCHNLSMNFALAHPLQVKCTLAQTFCRRRLASLTHPAPSPTPAVAGACVAAAAVGRSSNAAARCKPPACAACSALACAAHVPHAESLPMRLPLPGVPSVPPLHSCAISSHKGVQAPPPSQILCRFS